MTSDWLSRPFYTRTGSHSHPHYGIHLAPLVTLTTGVLSGGKTFTASALFSVDTQSQTIRKLVTSSKSKKAV